MKRTLLTALLLVGCILPGLAIAPVSEKVKAEYISGLDGNHTIISARRNSDGTVSGFITFDYTDIGGPGVDVLTVDQMHIPGDEGVAYLSGVIVQSPNFPQGLGYRYVIKVREVPRGDPFFPSDTESWAWVLADPNWGLNYPNVFQIMDNVPIGGIASGYIKVKD